MARFFILLLVGFLLLGCVTSPPAPAIPTASASIAASVTPTPTDATASATASPYASVIPTADSGPSFSNALPRIASSSASPSNPDRNEPFRLEVTASDDLGVKSISWESSDALSGQPDSPSFDCGLQPSCSTSFTFKAATDGERIIRVYVTDSTEQESPRSSFTFTVRPFDYKVPTPTPSAVPSSGISSLCGNDVCDASESASTCSADCPAVSATVDANACTSNEACGRKQICQDGQCTDVDCTNDSHCGYGKECSYYSCVRCRSGPYGPAC